MSRRIANALKGALPPHVAEYVEASIEAALQSVLAPIGTANSRTRDLEAQLAAQTERLANLEEAFSAYTRRETARDGLSITRARLIRALHDLDKDRS